MKFQISSTRETGRKILEWIFRKVFSKKYCFIRCRRQHLWAVKYRKYSRFTFVENTILLRAKFLGSHGLFCFISICKFGSFKNTFPTITSLYELYFRFRRFILLVQTKEVISMNYGNSRSSWKPWRWVTLDLILKTGDIYINSNLNPLKKFTSSSRSSEFKDILPRNISQMITKAVLISTRIVISYTMKQGISSWVWQKVNGNWDDNIIRISQWRESHCRINTSITSNELV